MIMRETRGKQHEHTCEKDSALLFNADVRRTKRIGLWAAGKMASAGDAAEAYAKAVVKAERAGGS